MKRKLSFFADGLISTIIKIYLIPFSRNYEAIDELIFNDIYTRSLFQISIAKQHSIKEYGKWSH